jgi:hypothetical protein
MKKTIVLVDGGFLRSQANEAKKTYDVPFIQKFSLSCLAKDEECLRILYYDCAPYTGTATLPISGGTRFFGKPGQDQWLHDLAALD